MSHIALSPLTRSSMLAIARGEMGQPKPKKEKKSRPEPERVQVYECAVCGEWHEDYEDAANCCWVGDDEPDDGGPSPECKCPVCGEKHEENQLAADCCLRKDVDAPTRWRIAGQVDAGMTWEAAIAQAEGGAA